MNGLPKRGISLGGHKTSISLEDEFWTALGEISETCGRKRLDLIRSIDADRVGNLSSAIRVFVLNHYRQTNEKTGHHLVAAQ